MLTGFWAGEAVGETQPEGDGEEGGVRLARRGEDAGRGDVEVGQAVNLEVGIDDALGGVLAHAGCADLVVSVGGLHPDLGADGVFRIA